MKNIVIIFSMIFAICTLNAEEAIKGFENGMMYKSGTEVEFTFDGVQINIESQTSMNSQQRCLPTTMPATSSDISGRSKDQKEQTQR
jgi:hypothetical protein